MRSKDFLHLFRNEHQNLQTHVASLQKALKDSQTDEAKDILDKIRSIIGPHFEFEADYLYPRLQRLMRENILLLQSSHEMVRKFFEEALDILDKEKITHSEKNAILDRLSHFSHIVNRCNELTSFAEQFSIDEKEILNKRYQECREKVS